MRGAIVTPPVVRRVVPTFVPQIDRDGNELAGIKSPLVANPLGTYLGWNVTGGGFFKGQACGFQGGYWPFAATKAAREAAHDPRPSLEERYGAPPAYVASVREAAAELVSARLLLPEDAERYVAAAEAAPGF